MNRQHHSRRPLVMLAPAAVVAAVFSVVSVPAGRGLASTPSPVEVPARCGNQSSDLLAAHLSARSVLLRVSCASQGETFRLISGRQLQIQFPLVWVLEFEGPYSNTITGISGVGCWHRIVDAADGRIVGTGGGPCSQQ